MHGMKIGDTEFQIVRTIAKGSYGSIYLTKDNKALKVIENVGMEGIRSLRELDIMSRISHPNLMHAEKIVTEFDKQTLISKVGILMERAERDLNKAMYDGKLSIEDRISILHQITLGLSALHESGYLHLDLKPLNILLFQNRARITDFGLSLLMERGVKEYPNALQTVDFRAVEVLQAFKKDGKNVRFIYSAAQDVWSLGMIFLEVLSGRTIFSDFKEEDYIEEKVLKRYEDKLEKNIDKTLLKVDARFRNVISRMLDFNPDTRITIKEVLNIEVFKGSHSANTQANIKSLSISAIYVNPFINNSVCSVEVYGGFDVLFKMAVNMPIRLETFFLAVDIYQRSLIYLNKSETAYLACLSMFMAMKMIESYYVDEKKLREIAGISESVKDDKILIGESVIVNNGKGILYPNNLFRASTTERRLLEAVELSRNCFLYSHIDLKKWRQFSEEEEIIEGKFDKYIPFSEFVGKTKYYHDYISQDKSYIQRNYENDRRN